MRRYKVILSSLLLASVLATTWSDGALAGSYIVTGTCSAWTQPSPAAKGVKVYSSCPRLFARNESGDFSTPNGASGSWVFQAPGGTSITALALGGTLKGGPSWRSRLYSENPGRDYNYVLQDCNSEGCTAGLGSYQTPEGSQSRLVLVVKCVDSGGCPNSGIRGYLELVSSQVTLTDGSAPAASVAGGSLTGPGWHGGKQTLNVSASDNTGIRYARALVDGDARYSSTVELGCDFSHPLPCSNHEGVGVEVNLSGLPDGQHSVAAQADDAAGNPGTSAAQPINVDNTAPLAPQRLHLAGASGWRRTNEFTVGWSNPAQSFAPIAAASYELCPQGDAAGSARCRAGTVSAPGIDRAAVQVPGPGAWTMRLWLADEAGNASPENAVTIGGLRLVAGRRAADGSRRSPSHLAVGLPRHGRLRTHVRSKLGRRVTLRGRLRGRRAGLARRSVLVYQRVSVQGASYQPVTRLRTDRHGRFKYKTSRGPSRRLQFVYPGGDKTQGQISTVSLRVRARLSIHPDRRNVRNGEYVTLSGRLRGGTVPPGGALLELQVYTRGSWRPFATPRTGADGKWSYQYRFETVSGTARFRFRAELRKQATYPFTARSKSVAVTVRGL